MYFSTGFMNCGNEKNFVVTVPRDVHNFFVYHGNNMRDAFSSGLNIKRKVVTGFKGLNSIITM